MAEAAWRYALVACWVGAILVCLVAGEGARGGLQLAARRVSAAAKASPAGHGGALAACLGLLAACLLPFGLASGFLRPGWPASARQALALGATTFVLPGVVEELLFRVLPLPGPTEAFDWVKVSVILFVFTFAYHMDAGHARQKAVFDDWRFLSMALMVGAACTFVYVRSGSLWLAAAVHWLPVWLWLAFFGGASLLAEAEAGEGGPQPRWEQM